jgi:ABC-type metal ion transport system substrate-binding protein
MSPACHLGPAILELVAALRSPEARKFVQDTYHGAVLTTF